MDFGAKSFTGMYLLLESLTFAESLAVPGLSLWGEQRAAELAMDGQKFWFVGLVCGLLAGVLRLTAGEEGVTGGRTMAEKRSHREREKGRERKRRAFRRVVADAMDLAVPGSVVGWVPLGPGMVSSLMLESTVLTGMEVWERCGREAAAAKAALAGSHA
jgi:hypothetical protein